MVMPKKRLMVGISLDDPARIGVAPESRHPSPASVSVASWLSLVPDRKITLKAGVPCPGRIWAQDRLEQAPPFGEERVPTALSQETGSWRGSRASLSVPRDGVRRAFRAGDALPNRLCAASDHRTGVKVRNFGALLQDVPARDRSGPGAGRGPPARRGTPRRPRVSPPRLRAEIREAHPRGRYWQGRPPVRALGRFRRR